MKKFAVLTKIDHEQALAMENASEFLYHLQNSLLLALQELGRLNAMQYRQAAQRLWRQRLEQAKKPQQKGEGQ